MAGPGHFLRIVLTVTSQIKLLPEQIYQHVQCYEFLHENIIQLFWNTFCFAPRHDNAIYYWQEKLMPTKSGTCVLHVLSIFELGNYSRASSSIS